MLIRFFCSLFSSKNFCEHSERWPPSSEMKLFMGEAGKSCVEVCKMSGELNNVYCNTIYTSSETQGRIVGARESLNGRENMARIKVKNGEKSPLGQCLTRPVPNCRGRSGFCLVPENFCVFLPNQKAERPMEQGGGGRRKGHEEKILKGWEVREIEKVNSPSRVFCAAPSLRACLSSPDKGEKITPVIQAT